MREIKYRGKIIDSHQNKLDGLWVYGYITSLTHITGKEYFIEDFSDWGLNIRHKVDPNTIGQYTGLIANKKEIYEDDILKHELCGTTKVIWEHGGFRAIGTIQGDLDVTLSSHQLNRTKVIGNIHDNPELFTK